MKGRKFREKILTNIFAKMNENFHFHWWTKFSRKRLNKNLETLVIYGHRQVGQAAKNGDASKEGCLNIRQQCFKCLYFKRRNKTKLS